MDIKDIPKIENIPEYKHCGICGCYIGEEPCGCTEQNHINKLEQKLADLKAELSTVNELYRGLTRTHKDLKEYYDLVEDIAVLTTIDFQELLALVEMLEKYVVGYHATPNRECIWLIASKYFGNICAFIKEKEK